MALSFAHTMCIKWESITLTERIYSNL